MREKSSSVLLCTRNRPRPPGWEALIMQKRLFAVDDSFIGFRLTVRLYLFTVLSIHCNPAAAPPVALLKLHSVIY